jgi:hypothetical protein
VSIDLNSRYGHKQIAGLYLPAIDGQTRNFQQLIDLTMQLCAAAGRKISD